MQQSTLPLEPAEAALSSADLALHLAQPAGEGQYDELRQPDGQLRPIWQRFFETLEPVQFDRMDRQVAAIERQIHDDGATYNVYSAQDGMARPWSLELLPFLISPQDWRIIESGVQQRVSLLDAVLADVYGPQRLLSEGLLPPALVLGHPAYLRPLQGHVPQGGRFLQVAAFDLAHGPDGRWRVMAQRAQAPSGLGYALENRLIVSRQFPASFRDLPIEHLASAYRLILETLYEMASRCSGGQPPRLALLTPGPFNETYFEHTYLAQYLGLSLVEGSDLIVRDERLYMKTVQGLQPIHGLLRRLDDDYCDPLELRSDSTLGVPGLLQAVRAGHLAVMNPLGAGLLESPGMHAFLPAICRRQFGTELELPALPTWWCGEAVALQDALPWFDELTIHPTYPSDPVRGFEPVRRPSRKEWLARITADPDAHTLQDIMPLSQTPVWRAGRLVPQSAMLRVYAVIDDKGGWRVVPGGLVRTAAEGQAVSMQRGSSSLDAWVFSDEAVDTFSMLPRRLDLADLEARRRPVSSRTGENLYWMGRYTERAENQVRLANALCALVGSAAQTPPALLEAMSELAVVNGMVPAAAPTLAQAPRVFERAFTSSLIDTAKSTSIGYHLGAMERTAAQLLDRLAPEYWRLVRAMEEDFLRQAKQRQDAGDLTAAKLPEILAGLATQLAAATGIQTDRMTRDHGWRLLTVGRLIERLGTLAGVVQSFFETQAVENVLGFDILLTLFDSTITFRARYQRRLEPLAMLDLLVFDESNPRALACVLRRLRTELAKLPRLPDAGGPESLLEFLPPTGVGISLEDLWGDGSVATDSGVAELAEHLQNAAMRLSNEVVRRYFAHADGPDRMLSV